MTSRIAVIGDSLLDVDVEGVSTRRCPDSNAPVVDEVSRGWRAGGAGLAALIATELGAEVTLLTALAEDPESARLRDLLGERVEVVAMPMDGLTSCKSRIWQNGEVALRLDQGDGRAARKSLPDRALERISGVDAVLVSDYGRGVAAHPDVRRLVARLAKRIPVVWDPHPKGPPVVPGVMLVTPNDAEAGNACPGLSADEAARRLVDEWRCRAVTVTVGDQGAVFADGDNSGTVDVPEHLRSDGDTCGAGDAFAAAATVAATQTTDIAPIVQAAVNGAIEYLRAGGPRRFLVTPSVGGSGALDGFAIAARTRRRGGRVVATGGCFDLLHAGHVSLLEQARALGDVLIVCLNSDASVAASKGPGRPIVPAKERAAVLSALSAVDAVVIFDAPSPAEVLEQLRPDIWVKGSDYAGRPLDEGPVVRRHGGEIVLVPVLSGHSTSRLVSAAQRTA